MSLCVASDQNRETGVFLMGGGSNLWLRKHGNFSLPRSPEWAKNILRQVNLKYYATFLIRGSEWTLGWPNPYQVPQGVCCFARLRSWLLLCEMQSQKEIANYLKVVCWQAFLISMMGRGDHWSVWESENDRRHLKGEKFGGKPLSYFQFVGSSRNP